MNPEKVATRGEITDEVSSALQALWSGQYRSISCKDLKVRKDCYFVVLFGVINNHSPLKNAVGRYRASFRGFEQQDSHEFLTILVDWLHEELNEVKIVC